MKRAVILLSLIVFLAVSCENREQETQVSDLSFTPCQQDDLRSSGEVSSKVDVKFTNEKVQIKHYNFEVHCDFTTVSVTHTFVNGVLSIIQQGDGDARCICYTDVSYTISGISQSQVNVIFINGVQVYCHNSQSNCDKDVIISETEYKTAPNDLVSILDMEISGNCLNIRFAASGCSGNSWVLNLIDAGVVAESYPCQRSLRLSLENKEMCKAYITKEISFNIEDLQIEGNDKVSLNIAGQQLLYEY